MSMQFASAGVSLKGVNTSDFDFAYYIDARIPISQTKSLGIKFILT